MAYTRLENKTKGVASQVQANFEYIGSGNLLPKGGNNLDYTTGVYDLGSDVSKWNNLYVNSITNKYNEELHNFENIVNYTLDSSTSRVEFSGLNGDNDIIYKINCRFLATSLLVSTNSIYLHCNGDSGSNYGYESIIAYNTTTSAGTGSPTGFFVSFYEGAFNMQYSNNILFAKTGYERTILTKFGSFAVSELIRRLEKYGQIWNDISSTITSLVFKTYDQPFLIDTNIFINARR